MNDFFTTDELKAALVARGLGDALTDDDFGALVVMKTDGVFGNVRFHVEIAEKSPIGGGWVRSQKTDDPQRARALAAIAEILTERRNARLDQQMDQRAIGRVEWVQFLGEAVRLFNVQPGETPVEAARRVATERNELLALIGQAWDAMPECWRGDDLPAAIRQILHTLDAMIASNAETDAELSAARVELRALRQAPEWYKAEAARLYAELLQYKIDEPRIKAALLGRYELEARLDCCTRERDELRRQVEALQARLALLEYPGPLTGAE